MKRLAAILFFIVILFNFYGYRLVISYMQADSEAKLEKQVDKNDFNQAELITIKTKLNLPYYINSSEYERAYGSVTIEGISYQYVKQRVYNDTLELLCLPNNSRTEMQSFQNEITKQFAEGNASTPKKHSTLKISLPDFFQPFKIFSATCLVDQNFFFSEYKLDLQTGYRLKYKKPPKPFGFSC